MKYQLAVAIALLSMASISWSQEDGVQSTTQASWHPALNGDSGSLAFSGESERGNQITGGVTLSGTYNDNAFASVTDRVSNVGYGILPNLSITEARSRAVWTLNYDPGFLWNQRMSPQHQANHNLDFNAQYRITEHISASIHNNFVDQSSSFNQLSQSSLLSGGNVLSQPNQSVITPLAKQLTNVTNADVQDQIEEGTTIGVSGSFNKLSFQEVSNSPVQLYNNEAWSGSGFLSHHISVRHSVGVTYTFQDFITFGSLRERSQSQSIVLFYTLTPKPGVTLSVFSGPDHSTTNSQFQLVLGPFLIPINHTDSTWLADEGATFSWQGQKTSASLNFIHHVTDGGGLTGVVQAYSSILGLRRQLSKCWTGDIALSYGDNNPLNHAFGGAFSGYGGSFGIERLIQEHVSVTVRYGRAYQRYGEYGAAAANSTADHNQAWVAVNYHFSRPLGR